MTARKALIWALLILAFVLGFAVFVLQPIGLICILCVGLELPWYVTVAIVLALYGGIAILLVLAGRINRG